MDFLFQPELVEIDAKEWNPTEEEKVFVREPSAGEYALYESIQAKLHWNGIDDAERRKVYAEIAVKFARDANGRLLFGSNMIEKLACGSSKPLRRIALKVSELSKIDDNELAELEKNSSGNATTG